MSAAYPDDLADFVLQQWPPDLPPLGLDREALTRVLSICYHASLTTEEGRPVRFRLLLAPADSLSPDGEPNRGALPLRFERTRPLEPDELRRLSPAVPFDTGLIGAYVQDGDLRIWGIAHTGAAWLAPSWGGRSRTSNWTLAPIIHVLGPGRLAVRAAGRLIAGLERGALASLAMDVFESEWLPALFVEVREDLRRAHFADTDTRTEVDHSLIQTVSQHMLRRVVRLIRGAGHGGMILVAEPQEAARSQRGEGMVRLKYGIADGEPRRRYQTLLRQLMEALAVASSSSTVGWEDFRDADDPVVAELERSIFELSRLVAALAGIDGAVLLDKRFELVGFGAEVAAELPSPQRVWRALDAAGVERECDLVESVGTRHRAAYRFIQSHPSGLAIVVSHDGAVRFVAQPSGGVTYWEQAVGP